MKVLITGGGGFLGYRLARELLSRDKNSRITLLDGAFPSSIEPRLKAVKGDIADAATVAKVLEPDTDAVFHLAAVVSGAAGKEGGACSGANVSPVGARAACDCFVSGVVQPAMASAKTPRSTRAGAAPRDVRHGVVSFGSGIAHCFALGWQG